MIRKYVIEIYAVQDIDTLETVEEREELEELIDEEITKAQTMIEEWCEEYDIDYELFENHRCIVETYTVYQSEELPGILKTIENNILEETSINIEEIED